jgi:hypothetical protein
MQFTYSLDLESCHQTLIQQLQARNHDTATAAAALFAMHVQFTRTPRHALQQS